MTRLPKPGGDDGTWGDILNDFLDVAHNSDGSLKAETVGNTQLDGSILTSLIRANSSVQSVNNKTADGVGALSLSAADVEAVATSQLGVSNGVASLDSTGRVPSAQVPDLSGMYVPLASVNLPFLGWAAAESYSLTSITRDANEAVVTATVVWPDGSPGTFTTDTASATFPGAIDAYHVTYGRLYTFTQPLVTRDAAGAVTAQPALAVTGTGFATVPVSSQASMLALSAGVGDLCVRTDLGRTFQLGAEPASTLANWQILPGPTGLSTPGAAGTNGSNGTNGQGVPTGGTAGQVLTKVDGSNYNTAWGTPAGGLAPANNLSDVANAGSSRANLHVPMLVACQAVALTNITLAAAQTIDGYAAQIGDQILCVGQTAASQNGPWVVATGAWTRPTDYATGLVVKGRSIQVNAGSAANIGLWTLLTSTSVTVGTTATTWSSANQARNDARFARLGLISPNLGSPTACRETGSRQTATGSITPSNQTLTLHEVQIVAGDVWGSLSLMSASAAVLQTSPTTAPSLYFVLYDPTGAWVASSADEGASWSWATNTVKTKALASGIASASAYASYGGGQVTFLQTAGFYVGALVNIGSGGTGGTVPSLRAHTYGAGNFAGSAGWPAGTSRLAVTGSVSTGLPAPATTTLAAASAAAYVMVTA